MGDNFSRRRFVAVGAALATSAGHVLAGRKSRDDYSFLLLGDTHFDRKEHHDFEWMCEHFVKDINQVTGYCRHTQDVLPDLLKHAALRLDAASFDAAFTLHVGDLVEGICGNERLATQHVSEAWDFFKSELPQIPLLMTKGNHDVTGPGSTEAYQNVLMPATAEELQREKLEGTSYAFQRAGDLYAVFDAYDRTSIDWLEELVTRIDFRRLFVLLHMPVVPYNARSNWRVYYHPKQVERRQRLIDLLGQYRAIVFCGHLHKYSLLVRRCRTGRFAQLTISSIVKDSADSRKPSLESTAEYSAKLVNEEPEFSPETLADRKLILTTEQPFIEHFEYAHKSGFAVISVSEHNVQAEIYDGVKGHLPWKTVSLS